MKLCSLLELSIPLATFSFVDVGKSKEPTLSESDKLINKDFHPSWIAADHKLKLTIKCEESNNCNVTDDIETHQKAVVTYQSKNSSFLTLIQDTKMKSTGVSVT